jgi:Photosynthetic reaction centre cytochrome C subunit
MRAVIATAAAAALSLASAGIVLAGRDPGQIPDKFTNLQVLPKDIPRPALVEMMKGFTRGLGTRCEHCHLGEGNDLSTFDFASDERPTKATARAMIRMLAAINGDLLKGVGEPAASPKVTCYTCHRGELKPLAAPPAGGGAPRPAAE